MTRRKKLVLALVSVGGLAAATLTCSPGYLLQAGLAEGKILARRQPIEKVAADPGTSPETRRKLALVLQARTFAASALDLEVGESYTTFSRVDRDTLALVLSASRDDRFQQVTWWFPIVGNVPYKGYFDPDDALKAARKLKQEGYDTYLRPTSAFSTLGWFNDPLLSTLLRYDDVQLAATVIHELTHNTIFVPSQVAFNESFASFVGDRGAIEYFCGLEGAEGERCKLAQGYWADNIVFGGFLQDLIARLERVYADSSATREQKLASKAAVLREASSRYEAEVVPRLHTYAFRRFDPSAANNATLIARRLYFDRLDRFEAAYEAFGRDLPRATAAIMQAARDAGDPYAALESLIASGGAAPGG